MIRGTGSTGIRCRSQKMHATHKYERNETTTYARGDERRRDDRPTLERMPSRARLRCFRRLAIMSLVTGDRSDDDAGDGGASFAIFGCRLSKIARSGTACAGADGGVFSLSTAWARSDLRERLWSRWWLLVRRLSPSLLATLDV